MKISTYACDSCGSQKGEGNGWWLLDRSRPRFILTKWDAAEADAYCSDLPVYEHLCSESCVSKRLSKWIGEASGNVVKRGQEGSVTSDAYSSAELQSAAARALEAQQCPS